MTWEAWLDAILHPRLLLKAKDEQLGLFDRPPNAPQKPKERKLTVSAAKHRPPPGGGWKRTPKGWSRGTGANHEWRPFDWASSGKGGAKRYAKEVERLTVEAVEGPHRPIETHKLSLETTARSFTHRDVESFREQVVRALGTKKGSLINLLRIEKVEDHTSRREDSGLTIPAHSEFRVVVDHQASIPGHALLAHIDDGVVTPIHHQKGITRTDYERADAHMCDVCKTNRQRKKVYVVERELDGKHLIVGGECAREFQGANLGSIASAIDDVSKLFDDLGQFDEEGEGSGGASRKHDTRDMVTVAWVMSQLHGYEKGGVTRDRSVGLLLDLRENPRRVTDEYRKRFADAQKQIYGDWDAIKAWIDETIEADEKRGRFNEFFTTLQTLTRRDAATLKDMGRLAWIPTGYYKYEHAKKEQEAKGETTAYRGADVGKMHDLHGTWEVMRVTEKESDWGHYYSVVSVNDRSEKIVYRVQSYKPPEEGDKLLLRGKIKGYSQDEQVAFCTHCKPRMEKKAAQKEKDAKKAAAKARKATYDSWKAKAAEPDFWKTDPEQLQGLDISSQAYGRLRNALADSFDAALKRGDQGAWERIEKVSAADNADVALLQSIHQRAVRKPHSWYQAPTASEVDALVDKFPALKDQISESFWVKTPEYEQGKQALSRRQMESRDAWRSQLQRKGVDTKRFDAEDWKDYRQPEPWDVGVNLTGVPKNVRYGESKQRPVYTNERMPLEDQKRLHAAVSEIDTNPLASLIAVRISRQELGISQRVFEAIRPIEGYLAGETSLSAVGEALSSGRKRLQDVALKLDKKAEESSEMARAAPKVAPSYLPPDARAKRHREAASEYRAAAEATRAARTALAHLERVFKEVDPRIKKSMRLTVRGAHALPTV